MNDQPVEEKAAGSLNRVGRWAKLLVALWGGALLLPGIPLYISFCCLLIGASENGSESGLGWGIAALVAVWLGCGGTMFLAGSNALANKPSKPLRLVPLWGLIGGFVLSLVIGLGLGQIGGASSVLSIWFIILAAVFPPLAAVRWAVGNRPGWLTGRRAGVAFAAGATVSVPLAVALELLIPYTIIWLLLDLGQPVLRVLEELVDMLAGGEVARAVTSPGFLLALFELALIAPLVEELVKPLVTLPLLKGMNSRREAFLLGALAGAGFAALENIVYAFFGWRYWVGVLVLRALGAAVHSLGAGLTALGWHALLNRHVGAGRRWSLNYGLAAGQHALWNGSQVVWLALAGAMFFGPQPQETDVGGISIAVGLLALLALEGVALWIGLRTLAGHLEPEHTLPLPASAVDTDRAIALWAVICLAALLPIGLALLHGLWR